MSDESSTSTAAVPLRILMLFPHFNTPEQASSLRSWQLARLLVQKGHSVTVLAPAVDISTEQVLPEARGKLYSESVVEGTRLIRVYTVSRFRSSARKRLLFESVYAGLAGLRALVLGSVDVIVVAYPPAVLPVVALVVAKLRRKPLVFEMRDLMADALEATGYVSSRMLIRTARAAESLVLRFCSGVISVSPGIAKALISRGVSEDKISIVTNGYEPEAFDGADLTWNPREAYGWGDRFVVVYVGALTQSYDLPTLLRCAKRLQGEDDILFVVIGDGDRRTELERYCRDQGLKKCQFLGRRRRKEIPTFLAAADVGVHMFPDHPLWEYVLGNKLFDYFGSGLPVVYAGRGDMADLIERAHGGLVVPPEDAEKLAEGLLFLKSHPREAKAMGERGRRFVLEHYHRRDTAARFEAALVRLLREG